MKYFLTIIQTNEFNEDQMEHEMFSLTIALHLKPQYFQITFFGRNQ